MRCVYPVLGLSILALTSGCSFIAGLVGPTDDTVQLINNSDSTARVTVYFSDQQDIPEDLLTSTGGRTEVDVPPGGTTPITKSCDDLQAIQVHVQLLVVGDLGPDTDSTVYRDGTDFHCGDNLQFTITTPDVPVSVSVLFNAISPS